MIAGGLERPGEQRALGLQQELEGRRRDLVRGRAVLVGRDRDGDGRRRRGERRGRGRLGDAAPVVEPPTLRWRERPRVTLAQLAGAARCRHAARRARPSAARASKVKVAVATALHPERAHCRCTDMKVPAVAARAVPICEPARHEPAARLGRARSRLVGQPRARVRRGRRRARPTCRGQRSRRSRVGDAPGGAGVPAGGR